MKGRGSRIRDWQLRIKRSSDFLYTREGRKNISFEKIFGNRFRSFPMTKLKEKKITFLPKKQKIPGHESMISDLQMNILLGQPAPVK